MIARRDIVLENFGGIIFCLAILIIVIDRNGSVYFASRLGEGFGVIVLIEFAQTLGVSLMCRSLTKIYTLKHLSVLKCIFTIVRR